MRKLLILAVVIIASCAAFAQSPCGTIAQPANDNTGFATANSNFAILSNFLNGNCTVPISITTLPPIASAPSLIAGTHVTITGSWPNQTISSSGGISGALTANTIPVATGATQLGNGSLTDNGNGTIGDALNGGLTFTSSSSSGITLQTSTGGIFLNTGVNDFEFLNNGFIRLDNSSGLALEIAPSAPGCSGCTAGRFSRVNGTVFVGDGSGQAGNQILVISPDNTIGEGGIGSGILFLGANNGGIQVVAPDVAGANSVVTLPPATGNFSLSNQGIQIGTAVSSVIPSPVATSECPSTVNPFGYVQDVNGTWHTQWGVDPLDANFSPAGTLLFCRRTFFVDGAQTPTPFSNAFVVMAHLAGTGVALTNQDRTLAISWKNPSNDTASRYGAEGIQAEMDINGTPTWTGSPDGEATTGSFQLADFHTGALTSASLGQNAIRAQAFRESGAGSWGSCSGCLTAVKGLAQNGSTVNGNGMTLVALHGQCLEETGAPSNINCAGLNIPAPVNRFTNNWGALIGDFGTNAADFNIRSMSNAMNSGYNSFEGPTMFGKEIRTARAGASAPGNTDTAGVLTFAAVTSVSYTFLNTADTAAPRCWITPINPGAVTFLVTTLSATTLTVTASGSFTGSVDYGCIAAN